MYNNIYPDFIKNHINEQNCDDEFIGFLFKNEDNLIFKRRKDYNQLFVSPDKHDSYCNERNIDYKGKIHIILESPHVEEYFGYNLEKYSGNFTNSRPANGFTGKNIDKYFTKVFKDFLLTNLSDKGIYSVIIMNAITKQCSLGVRDTKIYRDRMWLNYWLEDGKNYFLKRIEKIHKFKKDEINLIFNCCTVGEHYKIDQNNGKYLFDEKTTKLPQYFIRDEYELEKTEKGEEIIMLKCRKYKNNGALTLREIVEATLEEKFSEDFLIKHYVRSTHPSTWNRIKEVNKFDPKEDIIRFKELKK